MVPSLYDARNRAAIHRSMDPCYDRPMAGRPPPDDDTLRALAGAIAQIGAAGSVLPTASLVGLGGLGPVAEGDGRLTIDWRAAEWLGHPLVVWQPEAERPIWWTALSPREQEVALLVADGLSNAAIAARLGVTVGTVKDHVHAVLTKARLRRRSQVAASLR